jgi:hypothetical protein
MMWWCVLWAVCGSHGDGVEVVLALSGVIVHTSMLKFVHWRNSC